MICLDTNAVIAAMGTRVPRVRQRLGQAFARGVVVGVSTITLHEMWYGITKGARPRQNATAPATFLSIEIAQWPFEAADAEEAGDIRARLEKRGTPIGPYDTLIAAQARRRGAVLVTANERDFARVPGLTIENWAT